MKYLISTKAQKSSSKSDNTVLDESYQIFFKKYEIELYPIDNYRDEIDIKNCKYLRDLSKFDGVIISGSGDIMIDQKDIPLGKHSKYSPNRDFTENYLIGKFIENTKKIIGICHGMQKINQYFGGRMDPYFHCKKATYSDQGVEHQVTTSGHVLGNNNIYMVNQYHDHCITKKDLALNMTPLAIDSRFQTIESFENKKLKILCMQWHPERKMSCNEISTKLLESFL